MKDSLTSIQLDQALASTDVPAKDKAWDVYRFLVENVGKDLPSERARALLLAYLKLDVPRPSVIHSQMLSVALKMSEAYSDFRLPGFLKIWDLKNLRQDDMKSYKAADGRTFTPLAQKLAVAIVRYSIKSPEDAFDESLMEWAKKIAADSGFLPSVDMVAVKVFETESNGRKQRMVKLVAADGASISADWHLFKSKPWEIAGRMYTVLPRRSERSGNVRVDTIALSKRDISEVFGKTIGYVDRFDSNHRQYHIFDNQSRHFVAESPAMAISVGDFVWFSPIIPAEDKFKSAIVLAKEPGASALQAFGITSGRVTYIDNAKGYYAFVTPDGTRGSGLLSSIKKPMAVGQDIRAIAFMRRGKDGVKRLHCAMVI